MRSLLLMLALVVSQGVGAGQLETVIERHGVPDEINTTAFDSPRPRIVTKILTYWPERVRFAFVANEQKPPFRDWRLFGAIDPKTDQKISFDEAAARLKGRR